MKYIKTYEVKTGKKIKTLWSYDDAIITLYYEMYGIKNILNNYKNTEEFANWIIGSTEYSLNMHALNIRWILTDGEKGLENTSNTQREVTEKFKNKSKKQLKKIVDNIINNMSDNTKLKNKYLSEGEFFNHKNQKPIIYNPLDYSEYSKSGKKNQTYINTVDDEEKIPVKISDKLYHIKYFYCEIVDIDGNMVEIKQIEKEPNKHYKNKTYEPAFIFNYQDIIGDTVIVMYSDKWFFKNYKDYNSANLKLDAKKSREKIKRTDDFNKFMRKRVTN